MHSSSVFTTLEDNEQPTAGLHQCSVCQSTHATFLHLADHILTEHPLDAETVRKDRARRSGLRFESHSF